ncbi:glycosyl transferase family protein [Sphingomonas sp. IC-56]|uniref:glycosyl transferase family protein n=1 Tax=Sphingomonas sp. IC-56 TaxID=2898529 RepID=UPI001E34E578|nr:glycosyl transferase family protein [Sphingomonas sp. IC-56]MCD2323389.1 glycosyl transferase family protein [Sphingomonas sp. IC-56]
MILSVIDAVARETTLFAAIWFIIGGLDDLLVDLIFVSRILVLRVFKPAGSPPSTCGQDQPGSARIAVFVAAWDESAVIERMLRATLARFDYPNYRLYVGCYPNDPATIAAVQGVMLTDSRVRMVIGPAPGPTTKADCLNAIWYAMREDETREGQSFAAVMLHDAEDVVHPRELSVVAGLLDRYAAVQIPVLPLRHPGSLFVSGHYLDEFAESHGKQLLVRQAIGAGLPLAGVGCAIRRDFIDAIAQSRGGVPFDASSLTEDYELGLTIGAMGGRTILARTVDPVSGEPVAVRAYFPHQVRAAVRQKARWMTGIALAGWDRTGWAPALRIGDHWMRIRDRRATLAIPVLFVAYCALLFWGSAWTWYTLFGGTPSGIPPALEWILLLNAGMLVWRTAVRALFVQRAHGWQEAALSVPRTFVANYISLFAARDALFLYLGILAGGAPRWEKTAHHFPDDEKLTRS